MHLSESQTWYYTRNGERHGPLSGGELRQRVAAMEIHPRNDLLWCPEVNEWVPAGTIDGLFERHPAAPAPSVGMLAEAPAVSNGTDPIPSLRTSRSSVSVVKILFIAPIGLALASIGWVGFWLLHDFLMSLLPGQEIRVPQVVIILVYCGSGFLLGKPLGLLLRAAGFGNGIAVKMLFLLLLTLAAGIGETVYAVIVLIASSRPLEPAGIIGFITEPLQGEGFVDVLGGIIQLLIRFLLAIGAWVGALSMLRPQVDVDAGDAMPSSTPERM